MASLKGELRSSERRIPEIGWLDHIGPFTIVPIGDSNGKREVATVNQIASLHDDLARTFFDRFVIAFATFDPMRIADLFATPGVTLRADGSIVALTNRDDVVRYYSAATKNYRDNGCRACAWSRLECTPTVSSSMLATVTWDLLHQDGSVMTTWRQSYYLTKTSDGPKAFASASHASD